MSLCMHCTVRPGQAFFTLSCVQECSWRSLHHMLLNCAWQFRLLYWLITRTRSFWHKSSLCLYPLNFRFPFLFQTFPFHPSLARGWCGLDVALPSSSMELVRSYQLDSPYLSQHVSQGLGYYHPDAF